MMQSGRNERGQFAPGHKFGGRPRERKGKTITCPVCGKEFYVTPKRLSAGAKWCSYKCAALGKRTGKPKICRHCGKEYYRPISQVRWRGSAYCSRRCQRDHARETGCNRGKKSPRWVGMKIKINTTDKRFSTLIRYRDGWTCQRCGKQCEPGSQGLHNSHFIGRANKAVRFDEENCDAACFGCHRYWETHKATEYRDWKIAQLGEARYAALIERSRRITKRTPEERAELTAQITQRMYEMRDAYEAAGGVKYRIDGGGSPQKRAKRVK